MDIKHYKTYVRMGLKIDKSRNPIQRIETATSIPSLPVLPDIAEALSVPLTKLLEERSKGPAAERNDSAAGFLQ